MTREDRELGMDRPITRRDFLNGVSVAIGGTLLGSPASRADAASQGAASPSDYPPALTGMRGSHPGSFEAAHALRDGRTWSEVSDTGETYDLVVVGAGLSGLAAAYYFRKKTTPDVRILILDNHDDFGGHAKRNEFNVDGRTLIARGGSQFIERPATFTSEGLDLLKEIGVNYNEPTYKRDTGFFARLGLRTATYFDKETFGSDRLVMSPERSGQDGPSAEYLASTPLAPHVQKDLLRLYRDKRDYLAGMSAAEKIRKLRKTSYQDYLLNIVKVHPDVLDYFHPAGPAGLTTDTTSCWYSFNRNSPGFAGLGLELAPDAPDVLDDTRPDKTEPTQFHFLEGNAGVTRLLVRSLNSEALPGKTMADSGTARLNYAALDTPRARVRIRLSSTVVRVKNVAGGQDPSAATGVEVHYVRGGKAYRVSGNACVLACNNAIVPYLAPELPAAQKEALRLCVRGVNMRTQIAIRNWKAFEKLGVASINCVGLKYPGYSGITTINEAIISLGDYKAPTKSEEPTVLTLWGGEPRIPGRPAREQFRAGRAELYATTFETYERKIRTHLARILGPGGFDPAREIAAITINRWPHGFAMGQNLLFDPDWSEDEVPWVVGRKRFGRITIANSDAGAVCLMQCAFDQAYRAVDELNARHMAWWNVI